MLLTMQLKTIQRQIIFLFLGFNFLGANSQTLGGHSIADYLISAIHPNGCSSDFVTGAPDDSTWVNFSDGDVMKGYFEFSWTDSIGDELLLETSYHPDNYNVRLLLSTGLYSTPYVVHEADWIQITDTPWVHIFPDCTIGMENVQRYILPLDFDLHFGLNASDVVIGIEITFLSTLGSPDLAGVYIISEKPCGINLGNDVTLCLGETLLLDATTLNATYNWQDNSINPTFVVSQEGVYWVVIENNNCTMTDTINVLYENCEIILEIPTVFTPNSDGINDYFQPKQIKGIMQSTLSIYNRWGQKLIETDELLAGWDGKYNNMYCSDGTYFWVIKYITIANESITLKGFLTLIK